LSRASGEQSRPAGIAVFGSSEPVEGDPLYERAFQLGRSLAEQGHVVVTGGYGGVMEAASRGAHEAGGKTIGVTCRTFASRQPNPYLSEVRESDDLHDRTRALIGLARGFVILPGKAGTLAELSFLWALDRAGCLGPRPVVLLGDSFGAVLDQLGRSEMLDREQIEITRIATSPQEVLDLLGCAPGENGASR
jgi:uncharacterized protein (TIGR00730 family)